MCIKKFFNFLIFGKISLGHKEPQIFEEKATDENSIRYHFTTKTRGRGNDNSRAAIRQVGRDFGYMAMMFPFSPPVENNNMPPSVEEINDRVDAQNNRLLQVKRKRDVMFFEDESLFKKHKNFASVSTVDPITKISLAEQSATNDRRPVRVVVRSAPVDLPQKRF